MWKNIIKELVRRKMRHGETGLKTEVKKQAKVENNLGGE
jgi:hypothetical protein